MAVFMQEPSPENPTDRYPLLMEPPESNDNHEHIIDIERDCDFEASSSSSSPAGSPHASIMPRQEDRPSTSLQVPIIQSPSSSFNGSNSRSSSVTRRVEGRGCRHWSPFNTILWLSIELVFTVCQIIAASVSGHEKPQTPLFAWIVGYAVGCAARHSAVMDHSKMALDCLFAVWFVVGNVWIFGGNSSSSDAPNLYRCVAFAWQDMQKTMS